MAPSFKEDDAGRPTLQKTSNTVFFSPNSRPQVDGLKTPHVALAARALAAAPKRRFRLGEFVPMVLGKGLRGAAQRDVALDPTDALRTDAAVDLRLYRDKKLLPELERLFAPFSERADVRALLREPPRVVADGRLGSADAAALLGFAAPAPAQPRKMLPERFFLAVATRVPASTEFQRRGRGVAAPPLSLHGISTWHPRRCRDPPSE